MATGDGRAYRVRLLDHPQDHSQWFYSDDLAHCRSHHAELRTLSIRAVVEERRGAIYAPVDERPVVLAAELVRQRLAEEVVDRRGNRIVKISPEGYAAIFPTPDREDT
jgi:hypothetical protein